MLDTIRALILDFHEAPIGGGVPRRLELEALPGKAAVCIGVRRCGKSTYLGQIMRRLVDEGTEVQNILYLNFFDDRLHGLRREGLGLVSEAYYSLFPEKKNTETVYCFFDEIQVVEGWEPFVERLMRTERCQVFLTGSSSQMLSKEIATQMRGRALTWELFPFSFREFLDSREIPSEGDLSTRSRLMIRKAFEEYWEAGGFPEVLGLARRLRVKTHQEYLNAVLFRDLIERHDVSHPRAVVDLAHRLIDNVASLYSVNSLTGFLKSVGHKVPKTSVSDYLGWFEDAFFLFTVQLFDASLARRRTNPKKIYCVDHALVTSVTSGILVNSGHLLENLVFTALRRTTPDVFYYKTRAGKEVDFVLRGPDGAMKLVQVCESLAEEQTRRRELKALTEGMEELELASGTIVTRNTSERVEVSSGTIDVLPVWRFLVSLDGAS